MKLIYSFFLIKKNQKIKTAPARAKTPSPRLNGNELASLKQISVLTAFVQGFLNARSDEVGSSFAARLRHRLSTRECASLFLSTRARLRHRLSTRARLQHRLLPGCLLRKGACLLWNVLRCSFPIVLAVGIALFAVCFVTKGF